MARLIPNKVITFESELLCAARWTAISGQIETGGDLYGAWSHSGSPIVWFTTGPGPQAVHESTYFCQDATFLNSCGKLLIRRMGLQHIGQWHSHHELGLHEPSQHDHETVQKALARHALPGFLLVLLYKDVRQIEHAGAWLYNPGRTVRQLPFCLLSPSSPIREQLGGHPIASQPDTIVPFLPRVDRVSLDTPLYQELEPQ